MEMPFSSQVQQLTQFWQKAAADQMWFVESFYDQLSKVQSSGIAQISTNIDEANRLAKQSIAQTEKLALDWRKLVLETARRAQETVAPAQS